MQDNSITSLRERLEQMSTEQLDRILQEELDAQVPNASLIRTILRVLWEREKDMPREITPGIEAAWERFREREAAADQAERKHHRLRYLALRLGAVAAVLVVILFAIPGEAEAENLFTKLARWSESVVDFFSPERENKNMLEYEFHSTHPGLQQVYDAVQELGITVPVVPSWIPEGYELTECKVHQTSHKAGIAVNFRNEDDGLLFKMDVFAEDVSHEYQCGKNNFTVYEFSDVSHTILRNNDRWVVIWFQDNIECFLTVDCAEGTLYEILKSIYVTEDKHETAD